MKTRALRFQLLVWYAALLTAGLALLGLVAYLALRGSLTGALKENQLRRARQIAQLLQEEIQNRDENHVGTEIEARYAPGLNDRFVRITRRDGVVIYLSQARKSQSFDPASVAPASWPAGVEAARQAPLVGGRRLLLAAHALPVAAGASYLVETGAPMDEVQSDLRKWLSFLAVLLPVIAMLALGGGWVLIKRALAPVDRIAASAERISSHNLSERLPLARTGDELERLSVALNHMIERLDSAFQHSRRFVADASHELRTPLTTLRCELESLAQESKLNSVWSERLGSALEEVERLSHIVEGLFAISRLDAGEAAAEWLPFDLAVLAASTAEHMALLAEDKKIELTSNGSMNVWVQGDRARLKQVVVNLLDNAIKYTPEGGKVSLSVNARENRAVLEVTDTGIGIPPEALPSVFDRFFRADKARAREAGGAGLGLAIVKSICAAHQGSVEASSAPGQGSRFRVELPLINTPSSNHKNSDEHQHTNTRS